ncbi:MAG: methyltransferase domain-containing protein [Natronosporangium sp.]
MSDYLLDQEEQPRLAAQAARLDPVTFRRLHELGVGAGWRCLEVGGGTGSVAGWLRERVGERGHVVVTDVETRWLAALAWPNLEVRQHDITVDPVEPDSYDLIHARLVLMHLPDPEAVLAKLIAALHPGGWLLVEEADWHSTVVCHPPSPAWTRVFEAVSAALESAGQDLAAGRRLPAALTAAGLTDIAAEGTLFPMPVPELGQLVLPLVDRVREQVLGSGVRPGELDEVIGELGDDKSPRWAFSPLLVSAHGRRARPGPAGV